MKTSLLILFLSLCTLSKAQSWCPNIGTYWYYADPNNPVFCSPGYAKYDYYKDSLINGHNCQMIRRFGTVNCSNGLHSGYGAPFFTYTNSNQVVYVNYTGTMGSAASMIFDTLYWFNASIGSKWQMTHQSYTCSLTFTSVVTVQDTGHRAIQGINLRWQKVDYTINYGGNVQSLTDTIYERFGYLKTDPLNVQNFCSNIADIQSSRIFRCYGDNQLTNLKYKYTGACDYYDNSGLSIGIAEETEKKYDLSVFPNPAQGTITLQSETTVPANTVLEIQDHLGKIIWKGAYNNHVDISKLSPGMYFLTVKDATAKKTFKIIKE